jgi:hypothetical protein
MAAAAVENDRSMIRYLGIGQRVKDRIIPTQIQVIGNPMIRQLREKLKTLFGLTEENCPPGMFIFHWTVNVARLSDFRDPTSGDIRCFAPNRSFSGAFKSDDPMAVCVGAEALSIAEKTLFKQSQLREKTQEAVTAVFVNICPNFSAPLQSLVVRYAVSVFDDKIIVSC